MNERMNLRPWYNQDANFQTNAKSFMDYLARTNKFLEVLIEDYENFQELVIEELERIKFDSEMAVDDILVKWLEDGTLARIINDGVLGNKADKKDVEELHDSTTAQLAKTVRLINADMSMGEIQDILNQGGEWREWEYDATQFSETWIQQATTFTPKEVRIVEKDLTHVLGDSYPTRQILYRLNIPIRNIIFSSYIDRGKLIITYFNPLDENLNAYAVDVFFTYVKK